MHTGSRGRPPTHTHKAFAQVPSYHRGQPQRRLAPRAGASHVDQRVPHRGSMVYTHPGLGAWHRKLSRRSRMLSHKLALPASRALPPLPYRAPINNQQKNALPQQSRQSICYSQRPHHVPETSGAAREGKSCFSDRASDLQGADPVWRVIESTYFEQQLG